jgi:hypothetical protein
MSKDDDDLGMREVRQQIAGSNSLMAGHGGCEEHDSFGALRRRFGDGETRRL